MIRSVHATLLGTCSLLAAPLSAQVHEAWTAQYPPTFPVQTVSHYAEDLAVASSGDTYIAATTAVGAYGLELARFDPNGAVVWSHITLGSFQNVRVGLSPTDGGIVLAAAESSSGLRVLKYDPAGQLQWSSVAYHGPIGGIGAVLLGRGLIFDSAGNAYLCGSVRTGPGSLDRDAFVASYDAGGVQRFITLLPGGAGTIDLATGIAADRAGGFFVAGQMDGNSLMAGRATFLTHVSTTGAISNLTTDAAPPFGTVSAGSIAVDGSGRPYLLRLLWTGVQWTSTTLSRYDTSGQPAGSYTFLSSVARPAGLAVSPEGRMGVVGSMNSGGAPAFTALFDANFALEWQRFLSIPGVESHRLERIILGANGDVTVGGAISPPNLGSGTDSAFQVLRYDALGNLRWSYSLGVGDGASQWFAGLTEDASGRVWLAGTLPSSGPSPSRIQAVALFPQAHSFCHGDGAAVACPCGNASGMLEQSGCVNSTGTAAKLVDAGDASVANDTLSLTCSGMDTTAIALLVEGSSATQPIGFGDGLRCFGGSILRLYLKVANAGVVNAPTIGEASFSAQSTALGGAITAGAQRVYQVYYRDASFTFCPSGGTFNLSNALLVTWIP